MDITTLKQRAAGYNYLLELLKLGVMPHWHVSYVSDTTNHHSHVKDGYVEDIYPKKYWPGDTIGDHLEFALKYDGVNLLYLNQIFSAVSQSDILDYVQSKPTGKYSRKIWFFYEFITGLELPLQNLRAGNYVDLLEREKYFCITPGERSPRHRVVNNLLGEKEFCPIVRRTDQLAKMESMDFRQRCEDITTSYSPELLRRALSYLYSKETKSSFEIEHIQPNASRSDRFIALLEQAEHRDFCTKEHLLELQNKIVDPRFADSNYRTIQNYVGQTVSYQRELIYYICPQPDDLESLMQGLMKAHQRMKTGDVHPIVHAAVIAYAFVYFHPFEDGNGRIHRFLIHNILAVQGMIPKGLMFPVSAVMLKNSSDYDSSLETFSKPLMKQVEYSLDDKGEMKVNNKTSHLYRHMDMAKQVEALYTFVDITIERELVEELTFLANYDATKRAIQEIIDMPDRLIDLFIQFCLQNNGSLSTKQRSSYFDRLTDDEISRLEQAVNNGYNSTKI